jgi:hypothetical protein
MKKGAIFLGAALSAARVRTLGVLPSLLHFGFGGGRPIGEIHAGTLDMVPTLLPTPGGDGGRNGRRLLD